MDKVLQNALAISLGPEYLRSSKKVEVRIEEDIVSLIERRYNLKKFTKETKKSFQVYFNMKPVQLDLTSTEWRGLESEVRKVEIAVNFNRAHNTSVQIQWMIKYNDPAQLKDALRVMLVQYQDPALTFMIKLLMKNTDLNETCVTFTDEELMASNGKGRDFPYNNPYYTTAHIIGYKITH